MSYPVYYPEAGDTLPILFNTFGASNESITLTGLAVTDIEIYKDGSVTQRSSDAGYTLLDTDGIDFDGLTGIHGFSIDLSDNTDAGFYAVGSWYHVVVSAVTVNGQTVSFVAAAFRIVSATRGLAGTALPDAAADAAGGLPISDAGGLDLDAIKAKTDSLTFTVAGKADANITHWSGTANPTPDAAGYPKVTIKTGTGAGEASITAGVIDANTTQISGDATAADNLEAALDGTGGVTISANLTGNITGNLSGSVGSVTGAVGSVTGNVGGNVVGTVASVVTKTGYSLASTGLDLVVPPDPSAKPVLGTASVVSLIGWFGAWSLNETNSTATQQTLRNSADNADLVTHTLSDNGTTFSSGTGA